MNMRAPSHNTIDSIPLVFALQQIDCIDVEKTMIKLTDLLHEVTYRTLTIGLDKPVKVTDNLQIDYHDVLELFVGTDGKNISPIGAELLHKLYDQAYLIYQRPPFEAYPELLVEFEQNADIFRHSLGLDLIEIESLDFDALMNIFGECDINEKSAKSMLYVGNRPITRVSQKNNGQHSTYFVWEDDHCRSHFCFPKSQQTKRLG